jgi:hypothetical protein
MVDITLPSVLKVFSSGGAAGQSIAEWLSKSKGDSRSLVAEIKDNLVYLDMVAEDDLELAKVIDKISLDEYRRLSNAGFNFNKLKRSNISKYPSLKGTELASWGGKETEELIVSIYDKIADLKIRYPLVSDRKNYRWKTRVNNIRKRIWLLLRHVSD